MESHTFGIGILPLLASLMFVTHIFLLIRGYDFVKDEF